MPPASDSSSAPTWSTHSTTKYLNGHSDSVGGVVVATRDDDIEWLKFIQNAAGAILSPFDSWLVLRGTKTLAVRMAQHNVNGLAIAEFLAAHPKVTQVIYPGLPTIRSTSWRSGRCAGFGGMLVVRRRHASRRRDGVCNRVRLMALAESLGGVETLICHPASMTHASVPPERRLAIGLTDEPGPDLGRHRGSGGPHRRPGSGARLRQAQERPVPPGRVLSAIHLR